MQANPRKLLDLFGNSLRYVVPIFQRHYVWSAENHWTPLLEDILEKLDLRLAQKRVTPHFLGALILDTVRKKSTKEVTRFLVIDGQQRITTLQLLIAAVRDYALLNKFATLAHALDRFLLNPDLDLMDDREKEQFKLWPTQFNRKVFCDVITAGSRQKVEDLYPVVRLPRKRKPEPRDRLVEAYVFFGDRIAELSKPCGDDLEKKKGLLQELYGVLKDDFAVVEIILDEQDDSQEIFNSLNARGAPLSQSDLLRSYVFMRAEKGQEDRDHLYDEYWSKFEDRFWDQWIRRGSVWSSHLDVVTRMFLSSRLGLPVDSRRVHIEYKNWIRDTSPFPSVEDELRHFTRFGARYRALIERPNGDPFARFAERLEVWDVSTAYPLVIYLLEESALPKDDVAKCLADLESFLVRRLVCGKDTKEYNKYFLELTVSLRKTQVIGDALRSLLLAGKGSTREWPDDAEFAHHWRSGDLYRSLSSKQLALVLKLVDERLRSSKTEEVSTSTLSIEHVMPQDWAENWPLDGELVPKEMSGNWFVDSDAAKMAKWEKIKDRVGRRNEIIHTIGNLTIVTGPLNGAMHNDPFSKKQQALKNSVLMLNRYFDGREQWDEDAIDTRAEELFVTARQIWERA
ncbi:MAG: DUF262 domain-containing protein [Planctomycetes bacterium]|nr:DUF262 domain-containing protein [Planctomycetota bacterium]